jgi:hypothetical protein
MRPEVPRGRPGKETAPSDTTSPILATRQALDEARLVAQVQELLGVVRLQDVSPATFRPQIHPGGPRPHLQTQGRPKAVRDVS